MSRNILLVEPAYKTKFPPLGLMKLSQYHKVLGDSVRFVKGWNHDVMYTSWDRIYIATLFTYNWKITVETIKWYKELMRGDISRIHVGGIMAGLMAEELWKETGIYPHKGVLRNSQIIGDRNRFVIDDMIPDYNLFDEIKHEYHLLDSYFGYLTRGCPNKCAFCGVHKLEPDFVDYRGLKPRIKKINKKYGEKQHLVFFDNNILESKKFENIIHDIIDLGFHKDAKYNNRMRCVDFNQGVDVRLINDKHLKLLSKIAINPLRIAFDNLKLENTYKDKIRLAAKHKVQHLSNYILYNFKDTPEDFWKRLKINIELNKEYGLQIYSFPMKYIPLNAKDRSYIDPNWNWQFIRSIQRILNVMKGSVMPRSDFFDRAFGATLTEFQTILYMPEIILMNRGREPKAEEIEWVNKFSNLTENEKKELLEIICNNRTKRNLALTAAKTRNMKLKNILDFYLPDLSLALFDDIE